MTIRAHPSRKALSVRTAPTLYSQTALLTPESSNPSLCCSNISIHLQVLDNPFEATHDPCAPSPETSSVVTETDDCRTPMLGMSKEETLESPLKERISLFESLSHQKPSSPQAMLANSPEKKKPGSLSKARFKAFIQHRHRLGMWRRFSRSREAESAATERPLEVQDTDKDGSNMGAGSECQETADLSTVSTTGHGHRHGWSWGGDRLPSGDHTRHRVGSWSWGRRKWSRGSKEISNVSIDEPVADLAIVGVQCSLEHPRPVRADDLDKLANLCRSRAGMHRRGIQGSSSG